MSGKNQISSTRCALALSYGEQISVPKELANSQQQEFDLISSQYIRDTIALLCERETIEAEAIVPVPRAGVALAEQWIEHRTEKLWTAFGCRKFDSSIFYATDDPASRLEHSQMKVGELLEVKDYKNIILIDEAILSGVTMKTAIKSLRNHGVKKIHVRTILPPFVNQCPHVIVNYKPTLTMNDDIAKILGADGFSSLTKNELITLRKNQFICTECVCV